MSYPVSRKDEKFLLVLQILQLEECYAKNNNYILFWYTSCIICKTNGTFTVYLSIVKISKNLET